MYAEIANENYGYSVATYGEFVAVGNPSLGRYTSSTSSYYRTGSIDIFKYDRNLDEHKLVSTIYSPFETYKLLLAAETGSDSTFRTNLKTELSGSSNTSDHYLEILESIYGQMLEDGYGLSLDILNKILVVGSPYWTLRISPSGSSPTSITGSSVDIFNLGAFEKDSYNTPNYTEFTKSYVTTLQNPDPQYSGSFGYAVSLKDGWLAVSSPYYSGSNGAIYLYRNFNGDLRSWSYYQKIIPPNSASLVSTPMYGMDLKLNKHSGSLSDTLIVGVGNPSASVSLLYEFSSSIWRYKHTFRPTHDTQSLTFGGYTPYNPTMNSADGFGTSVAIDGDTVTIGAPYDRVVYEYSGSSEYHQGAGYIFERCPSPNRDEFKLISKLYGTEKSLKNNRFGYCTDVFEDRIVFGIPKTNIKSMDSCYIGGTFSQLHFCGSEFEKSLDGQMMYLQKESGSWNITNVFQRKKKFLSPYHSFGAAVSIGDMSTVIGAPMMVTDLNRYVNIDNTTPENYEFSDISGKAYIYNHKNLRETFNVGNVFYRNGKVILMTSGSVFDGLVYNPISTDTYDYELDFKSQQTIYEKQIICTVEPGEFNVSTNPTAIEMERSSLDINGNGKFDFQDLDVVLQYMQYVNTRNSGGEVHTNWSSSVVTEDDEKSYLKWCKLNHDSTQTETLVSSSINNWEFVDTSMKNTLDLNQDNKIDIRDMNIIWKYFSNRLTQKNYSTYITPSCNRKLFSDIIDYMNQITHKNYIPTISSDFFDYERLSLTDKTGSFLAPYVTTIGLYSGLDLVAVAKLGTPIKIIPELPINFVIKMDF